ncbi:hypothetical protein [Sandaracinus amylolyticus]|uniref:hypothetical protein n=1 Tax=Sandaracinus amylolyticus TaxID=927083 RepID=UPI001F353EB2|nr:hypothetical protein [Sandaracinus amylolyticus]UJR79912.1 Hypothetical protein I5071_19520 [Sandaracinus amylolyticus]
MHTVWRSVDRVLQPLGWLLLSCVLGCGSRSSLELDVDAGRAQADAASPGDAGPAVPRAIELPPGFGVWDLVATADGDACLGGIRRGREASNELLEVMQGDAFIACFTPEGRTRAVAIDCSGASFGVHGLAAHPGGDLYALVEDGCVTDAFSVVRFDRALTVLASTTITSDESPPPYVRAIAASDDAVVVGGSMRRPGRVGASDVRHGPFAAILAPDDLATRHLVAPAPIAGEPYVDVGVSFAAIHGDRALLFGRDAEGGGFADRAGSFVSWVSLDDGALTPIESRRWHHQYGALMHPDGRPVLLGTTGGTILQLQVGDTWPRVWTGYAGGPEATFRGDELVIARPFTGELEIAGTTLSDDEWSGFLMGLDPITFEPAWARALSTHHYNDYFVAALPDGTLAVVATGASDREDPGAVLTFHR